MGSVKVIFFKAMVNEGPSPADIEAFLQEKLGDTNFPSNDLEEWKSNVKQWQRMLLEAHHKEINFKDLAAKGDAMVVGFDLQSLQKGGLSSKEAMDIYKELAEDAMRKMVADEYPGPRWPANVFTAVLGQLRFAMGAFPPREEYDDLLMCLEFAAMSTVECFAEQEAKKMADDS